MKEREALVAALRERGAIRSPAVAAAFAEVPRERFIPSVLEEHGIEAVYRDEAFVTKRDSHGMAISSSSQPQMMAAMLELLELGPGQRVLEVGAGTGYNAAVMGHIVGRRGAVTTIDVDPALARSARAALRGMAPRVSVVVGDGRAGWPDAAPYDRIIVTAAADRIPRAWLEQLTDGGRIVLPLRLDPDGAAIQLIPAFERRAEHLLSDRVTWGGFMPLHGGDGGWRAPIAQVSASRSAGGRVRSLGSISGAGLARVPERASAALLCELLADRGERRAQGTVPMGAGGTPLLLVYLLLGIPARRRVSVHSERRTGVGLVDRRTASLAVVSIPSPWSGGEHPAKVRWRLVAYGGEAAALELERLLGSWRELVRGGDPYFRLTAFGGGEWLRLQWRWAAGDATGALRA